MPRLRPTAAACGLLPLLLQLQAQPAAAHYDRLPCQSDEVQAEVQGASGYLCAPRCDASSYNCPVDIPSGSSAQAQCMMQDVERGAYCGLLCQVDAQCPSGARCQQLKQVDVGLCLFTVSFTDWAKQGATKKLAIGWPSQSAGRPAAGFQVAKTYAALQSLKQKYTIDDGDADMLTLKELLASLSAAASTAAPGAAATLSLGQQQGGTVRAEAARSGSGSWLAPWQHDVRQFEKYVSHGLPGIQEEIHDTIWNIEHINKQNTATTLLRGLILIGVVYIAVGSFIKYQTVGARGIEMLPHIGFWMEYPKLVADGVEYSKTLVAGAIGQPVPGGTADSDLRGGVRSGSGSFEAL